MSQDDAAERRRRLEERRGNLSQEARSRLAERLRGEAALGEGGGLPGRCRVEVTPVAGATRPPFFAVHPAGGDVLCFFPLARALGPDQPFLALQARGLEDDGPAPGSIEEMASGYCAEIRAVQPAGPYRLGGWSFGGLVAYEMARQLEAAGERVALLAVIDTGPGTPEEAASEAAAGPAAAAAGADDTPWLLNIAAYVKGLRGLDLGVTREMLAPLDDEGRLDLFVERLRRAEIFHSSGDSRLQLRRLLRVYKTNARLFRVYKPGPYSGPLTLLRGVAAGFDPALGDDLGWRGCARGPVEIEWVPGDHITLLAEPQVAVFAGRLRARLDDALSVPSPAPPDSPSSPPSGQR